MEKLIQETYRLKFEELKEKIVNQICNNTTINLPTPPPQEKLITFPFYNAKI